MSKGHEETIHIVSIIASKTTYELGLTIFLGANKLPSFWTFVLVKKIH